MTNSEILPLGLSDQGQDYVQNDISILFRQPLTGRLLSEVIPVREHLAD